MADDEEKKEEEEKKEDETVEEKEAGNDAGDNLVMKAEIAAKRLEDANKKAEELAEERAKEKVESALGGTSEAGIHRKELTEEEKLDKEARDILKGTGLSPWDEEK